MSPRRWSVTLRFISGPPVHLVAVAPTSADALTAAIIERADDGTVFVGGDVSPIAGEDVVASSCGDAP